MVFLFFFFTGFLLKPYLTNLRQHPESRKKVNQSQKKMWQDRPSGTKICHFKCSTRISNPAIRSTKKKANLNMTNGQTLQHLHTLKKTAKNDSNKHMLYLYNMVYMLYVIIYDYRYVFVCMHTLSYKSTPRPYTQTQTQ